MKKKNDDVLRKHDYDVYHVMGYTDLFGKENDIVEYGLCIERQTGFINFQVNNYKNCIVYQCDHTLGTIDLSKNITIYDNYGLFMETYLEKFVNNDKLESKYLYNTLLF